MNKKKRQHLLTCRLKLSSFTSMDDSHNYNWFYLYILWTKKIKIKPRPGNRKHTLVEIVIIGCIAGPVLVFDPWSLWSAAVLNLSCVSRWSEPTTGCRSSGLHVRVSGVAWPPPPIKSWSLEEWWLLPWRWVNGSHHCSCDSLSRSTSLRRRLKGQHLGEKIY